MDVSKKDTIPVSLPIKEIVEETPLIKTFKFEYPLGSKPGQFVMMWIPGVDEKPMSTSYDNGKEFWLTVQKVGSATKELFKLKKGDLIGIRGPFGTHFLFEKGDHIATVGGGCGCAPMYFLTRAALKKGCKVEYIVSASHKDKFMFLEDLKRRDNVNVHVAEMGKHGHAIELLKEALSSNKINRIFTCSHELAMKQVSDIAHEAGIFCQLTLERYMKCGFGVCGQCCIDPLGICVCKQGPIFNNALVRQMTEFGKYFRDDVGRKIKF
ncbi:dihydroorotate dehydrogenase electron transfer subunit [Patescibacteria group bacterium]|nr:dihydroorotate dehydrogenase electron transfer subunit [Patescibacteria group bacterium]